MRKQPGKYAGKLPDFVKDTESAQQVSQLTEEQLDTSEAFNDKLSGVSRRDFMRVSRSYGLTATYMAAAGMTGFFSAEALAEKAKSEYDRRHKKKAKHTLKLGSVSGFDHNRIIRLGTYHFARDLEDRTDGEIRIDILGSNSVCAEQVCVQKTIQGVLDIALSSTQNASSVAPWLNAIDFPYMFQSNGQLYHFLYNPKSEKLLRDVYRKKYRMELLFSLCEMRNLYMGLKWKDKPPITKIGDLAGTKNRVTNTQLGRIAMQLMDLNPVPVAWVETLDSLKNGLIDGMETWTTATTAFNMAPVVSQYVGLKFIPGTGHTAMNVRKLESLGSALRDEVMEAAYYAQQQVMYSNEAGLITISGETQNPGKDTIFGRHGTKMNFFSDAALKEFVESLLTGLGGYYIILFCMMGMVLATGTLLESVPNTIILAPILAPIAKDIGVDPFHFAVIFLIGDAIGFITPPYGLNLYVASGITGLPYLRIVWQVLPFLLSLLIVWVIVALIPELSTFLIKFAGLGGGGSLMQK